MKKICKNCELEFEPLKSHTKYCSLICCNRFNRKKILLKRKNDPEYKKKYLKSESERKKRKRLKDLSYRHKWNEIEKQKYRKKHNIKGDEDLKRNIKGIGTITRMGYRQISKKGHPNCNRSGTMFEHVFVMSEYLGRPLDKMENVHHKNGDRLDNRIDNLELWSRSQPPGQRIEDKINWCKEFLAQYGYEIKIRN